MKRTVSTYAKYCASFLGYGKFAPKVSIMYNPWGLDIKGIDHEN
jgi:hypothetical protein